MKETSARIVIAWSVVGAHLISMGTLLVYWLALKGFVTADATTALAIMGPITAAHGLMAYKWTIANRHIHPNAPPDKTIRKSAFVMTLLIIALFLIPVVVATRLKAENEISDFETYKALLGILEVVFGGYFVATMTGWFADL